MKRWRFETNRITSVATAQRFHNLKVNAGYPIVDFELTNRDLTFGDLVLTFRHKMSYSIVSMFWKNGGAAHRRSIATREKNGGLGIFCPPPFSARLLARFYKTFSVVSGKWHKVVSYQ